MTTHKSITVDRVTPDTERGVYSQVGEEVNQGTPRPLSPGQKAGARRQALRLAGAIQAAQTAIGDAKHAARFQSGLGGAVEDLAKAIKVMSFLRRIELDRAQS